MVSDAIELGYHFTQRALRRTFNDMMRAAQVEAIVTGSISGHLDKPRSRRLPPHPNPQKHREF